MDKLLKMINDDQAAGRLPVAGDVTAEQNLIPMMATPAVVTAVRATQVVTRTVTRRNVTRTQRGAAVTL